MLKQLLDNEGKLKLKFVLMFQTINDSSIVELRILNPTFILNFNNLPENVNKQLKEIEKNSSGIDDFEQGLIPFLKKSLWMMIIDHINEKCSNALKYKDLNAYYKCKSSESNQTILELSLWEATSNTKEVMGITNQNVLITVPQKKDLHEKVLKYLFDSEK